MPEEAADMKPIPAIPPLNCGPHPPSIAIKPPRVRPLKAYAFDPSMGRYLGNEMTFQVKYEKLLPGPIGERVAVTDSER
jgi:hypothetical protein